MLYFLNDQAKSLTTFNNYSINIFTWYVEQWIEEAEFGNWISDATGLIISIMSLS
jgi:hypothetical protein